MAFTVAVSAEALAAVALFPAFVSLSLALISEVFAFVSLVLALVALVADSLAELELAVEEVLAFSADF